MMTFYFWVLVVGVIGLSDGESVMCLRRGKKVSVTCSDDHQSPTEGYEKEIHLWCDNKEIICPVSLNNVSNDMKPQEVKCKTRKSGEGKRKTYYCQIEKPLYISALLSALPGKPGSQDWKNNVAKILEGVPGVQEWLNKSEEFWEGIRRPRDLLGDTFWKKLAESQDWLSRFKQFFPDKETSDPSDDDDEDDDEENEKKDDDRNDKNNSSAPLYTTITTFTIMVSLIVLLLILAGYSLGQRTKRNAQNHSS
ncbi:uncharacterized protein [Aquarana catesbeiana]|uniref:uncharacterized protein n=1 Tax=Aquarana catesbeiana TaxID=8400 RepID=UPI003CCA3A85